MKIENSSVQLSSQYSMAERLSIKESVKMWAGGRNPDSTGRESPNSTARLSVADVVTLSNISRVSQLGTEAVSDKEDSAGLTPELKMVKMIIERIVGREIELTSVSAIQDDGEDVDDS